jgi:hypothetical protein
VWEIRSDVPHVQVRKGGKVQKGLSHSMKQSQSSREWYEGSMHGRGIVYKEKEKEKVTHCGRHIVVVALWLSWLLRLSCYGYHGHCGGHIVVVTVVMLWWLWWSQLPRYHGEIRPQI